MTSAPFDLESHCGTRVSSEALLKRKNLFLYFFPPVQFENIQALGQEAYLFKNYLVRLDLEKNEVVGITDDPTDLKKTFVQRFGIPFHVLYDRDHQLAKNYGALNSEGNAIEPALICIHKGGRIKKIYKGKDVEANLKRMVHFTRLPWYRKLFRQLF